MGQRTVKLLARFAVPPETLWKAMIDHEGMTAWTGAKVKVVAGRGDGLTGTVRRMKIGPTTIDEEVVSAEPPRRYVYRIVRGLPGIRYHQGEVCVEPWEGGSSLTWEITMGSAIPGVAEVVLAAVRRGLNDGLKKLGPMLEGRA